MKRIEQYCVDELRRMLDATQQIGTLLPEMMKHATHPLLRAALDEQMMVSRRLLFALKDIFERLGVDNTPTANVEVAAMVNGTRRAYSQAETLVDVILAQQAARLETYQAISFEGLASWFHQLRRHDIADSLDDMAARLIRAVGHLRDIRASVSSLVKDKPHRWEPEGSPRPQDRELRSDLDGWEVY